MGRNEKRKQIKLHILPGSDVEVRELSGAYSIRTEDGSAEIELDGLATLNRHFTLRNVSDSAPIDVWVKEARSAGALRIPAAFSAHIELTDGKPNAIMWRTPSQSVRFPGKAN